MSWSINRIGLKAAVAIACTADLDRCAVSYKGHEEEKDILAAKERILAAIDGIDVSADAYNPSYGVQVTASGSGSKYSMAIQISVTRIALTMASIGPSDPPETPIKPSPHP